MASATYGFAARNGRTLADNAPEAMLSLVTDTAVPSGLKPSVSKHLRDGNFSLRRASVTIVPHHQKTAPDNRQARAGGAWWCRSSAR